MSLGVLIMPQNQLIETHPSKTMYNTAKRKNILACIFSDLTKRKITTKVRFCCESREKQPTFISSLCNINAMAQYLLLFHTQIFVCVNIRMTFLKSFEVFV